MKFMTLPDLFMDPRQSWTDGSPGPLGVLLTLVLVLMG